MYSPHAVEDEPEMILGLGRIRETSVGGSVLLESVNPTWTPGDSRASGLLNSSNAAECPEIAVRDPGELLLNLLHVFAGDVLKLSVGMLLQDVIYEAVVRSVLGLGLEAHGSVVGSASLVVYVVSTRAMPGEAKEYWGEGAV
jgi:hypothetical protein